MLYNLNIVYTWSFSVLAVIRCFAGSNPKFRDGRLGLVLGLGLYTNFSCKSHPKFEICLWFWNYVTVGPLKASWWATSHSLCEMPLEKTNLYTSLNYVICH